MALVLLILSLFFILPDLYISLVLMRSAAWWAAGETETEDRGSPEQGQTGENHNYVMIDNVRAGAGMRSSFLFFSTIIIIHPKLFGQNPRSS